MIKIENVEVLGWEAAIRGMRNPMNSWDKSDTCFGDIFCGICPDRTPGTAHCDITKFNGHRIGPNDLDLMTRLRNAGTDHRKFMRMITVYVDIVAPLYWWKEFDTYKVGTVANSCSTMHKIHDKEFTLDDFSCEHLMNVDNTPNHEVDLPEIDYSPFHNRTQMASPWWMIMLTIKMLNECREYYIKTKDKRYWWQMIQLLPSSYNQRRTVMLNYEVLANIYKSRKNHKLDEWVDLCKWIETLPYSNIITGGER